VFAVIAAAVFPLDVVASEDLRGDVKTEAALVKGGAALVIIPLETVKVRWLRAHSSALKSLNTTAVPGTSSG